MKTRGPELLIGSYVEAVARRIAAWGDGFMAPGGGEPAQMVELWAQIRRAWADAARDGQPRWVAGSYFALGPDADEAARSYVEASYGHRPELAAQRLAGIPTTPDAVLAAIARQAAMGVDEFILRPCSADFGSLEQLADLVGAISGAIRLPDGGDPRRS